jgi:hypothetical protein
MMSAIWAVGTVLNLLDLAAGTHFTKDPNIGLVLCLIFVPFTAGSYWVARKLGSRTDETLLTFLESALAASRVG